MRWKDVGQSCEGNGDQQVLQATHRMFKLIVDAKARTINRSRLDLGLDLDHRSSNNRLTKQCRKNGDKEAEDDSEAHDDDDC